MSKNKSTEPEDVLGTDEHPMSIQEAKDLGVNANFEDSTEPYFNGDDPVNF